MRVIARSVDLVEAPPNVARFVTPGQVFLTAGRQYEVFALAAFEGLAALQIVDDLRFPQWLPAWLFEVADTSIPSDWICNVFPDDPMLVAGPAFVADDQHAYARMVQLEANEVELFWRRVEALGTLPNPNR